FELILKLVFHPNSPTRFLLDNEISIPRFSILPIFCVMEPKPVVVGIGTLYSKALVSFRYISAFRITRFAKSATSSPALYCVVVSHDNPAFGITDGEAPE